MYTIVKAEEIVRGNTVEELASMLTKQQLTEIHIAIYGLKPLSSYNKKDIAHTLKQYFYQIDRASAFKSLM